MTGHLVDLVYSVNRKQRITLEVDQDFRGQYDELYGKLLEIRIDRLRKRRSLDANAYFWTLAGKLAGKLGISPDEVYRHYIPDVGGNSETVCLAEEGADALRKIWSSRGKGWLTEELPYITPGYKNIILYYGSSTYDARQMSRLIDMVVEDCKQNGIETLTPDKLDAMKERWGHAQGDKGDRNIGAGQGRGA